MSNELSCETIVMALLSAHASLTSFEVKHFSEDDTDVEVNRIVVQAMPEETIVPPRKPDLPPAVSRVPVRVSVQSSTLTASQFDTIITAVKAAADSAPAAVVTTATGLFPNGFQLDDTDEGEYSATDNRRLWEKTYNAILKR